MRRKQAEEEKKEFIKDFGSLQTEEGKLTSPQLRRGRLAPVT